MRGIGRMISMFSTFLKPACVRRARMRGDQRIEVYIGLSRTPPTHCPSQTPPNSPFISSPSDSPFTAAPTPNICSFCSTPTFLSPLLTNSSTGVYPPPKQLGHPIRPLSISVSRRVSHRSSSTRSLSLSILSASLVCSASSEMIAFWRKAM